MPHSPPRGILVLHRVSPLMNLLHSVDERGSLELLSPDSGQLPRCSIRISHDMSQVVDVTGSIWFDKLAMVCI